MVTQSEHWSYPVFFGKSISFTLPSTAGSVSIEADIDGQTIVFPLSPTLFLSWATCDSEVNPDQGRVFRCSLKPGYRFSRRLPGLHCVSPTQIIMMVRFEGLPIIGVYRSSLLSFEATA